MRVRDFEINHKVQRDHQVMRDGFDIDTLHDDFVPLSKLITGALRVLTTFSAMLFLPLIISNLANDPKDPPIEPSDSFWDLALRFVGKYAATEFLWGLTIGMISTVGIMWICLKTFKFCRKRGWTTIATPYELESLFSIRPIFGLPLCNSPIDELHDRKSSICEALMSLETGLSYATPQGLPRTIMVTSSRPAEGKSTLSIGLAHTISRTGRRAILIDGDLRSPSLASVLNVESGRGLSSYLTGDVMEPPVATPFGFDLISAGSFFGSSADLLRGDRLKHLIQEALEKYDHVIIDSPPVLGLVDAVRIAGECELTLYAIRANETWVYHALEAIRRLTTAATIVPIVTMIPPSQFGYTYGYGYQYADGYGSAKT